MYVYRSSFYTGYKKILTRANTALARLLSLAFVPPNILHWRFLRCENAFNHSAISRWQRALASGRRINYFVMHFDEIMLHSCVTNADIFVIANLFNICYQFVVNALNRSARFSAPICHILCWQGCSREPLGERIANWSRDQLLRDWLAEICSDLGIATTMRWRQNQLWRGNRHLIMWPTTLWFWC